MRMVLSRASARGYNAAMAEKSAPILILAGDVGGTNTNLALVEYRGGRLEIIKAGRYPTKAQSSIILPLSRFLDKAAEIPGFRKPDVCCISGAGMVEDGSIALTNAPWTIVSKEIEERFSFPTVLINDFTALSYAVVILDPEDPSKIIKVPHVDGRSPGPGYGMALVVGAGTGLGVGFVNRKADGSCLAFPSEGGHSEASAFDSLSWSLIRWVRDRCGWEPGIELFASGQGIATIFRFLCSPCFDPSLAQGYETWGKSNVHLLPSEEALLAMGEEDLPAAVALGADSLPRCALAMEIFLNFYARKVSSLACAFLPSGGIYLAGGISSKNQGLILQGRRFMKIFERNYAPHMRAFLENVPVFLVKDYSISLLGAANAAVQMGGIR